MENIFDGCENIKVFGLKKRKNVPDDELWVMVMLQRSEENGIDCSDVDVVLACTEDIDNCPAACKAEYNEEENNEENEEPVEGRTESGLLAVAEASVQPSEKAVIGVPAIEVGTLKLTAGDEDVNLYSISLEAMGTIPFAAITDVALQNKDGVKVTRTKNLNNKGEAKISFVNGYGIEAGSSETLTIIATIAGGGNGDTVAFKVTDFEGPEEVDGTPITTQYVSMTNNTNIGRLDVVTNTANTTKVKLGEEATLGQFSVKPDNKQEDLVIKSITVNQYGTIKTSYLDDLYLTVNGKKVSSSFTLDKDDIIFATNIELDKTDNSNVDVILKGTVTEGLGDNIQFQIEDDSDIIVEGQKYGTRVNVLRAGGAWGTTAVQLNGAAINIQGTAISVSFDKTDTESTLATSKADFGTLKLKAESSDYTFDKMFVILNTTCTDDDQLSAVKIVDITLGGDSYVGTPTCNSNKFSIEFDDVDLDAGVSRNLPLVVEFEEAAVNKTFKFDIELNDNEVLTDVTNDRTYHSATDKTEMNKLLSATSFSTRTIKIEQGGLTITANPLKNQDVVLANNKEVTFGMGQLKVTKTEDALLKALNIDATPNFTDKNGNVLQLEDIASKAYLTVDGTKYQGEIDGNKVRFTENVELAKGTSKAYELSLIMKSKDIDGAHCSTGTAVANAAACTAITGTWYDNVTTFQIKSYTYKVGNETVEKDSTTAPTELPKSLGQAGQGITLVTIGTLTADVDTTDNTATVALNYTNVDKTVLAGAKDVVLGRFKFNAKQEDIKVTKAKFEVTEQGALTDEDINNTLTNVRLATADGETVSATLTTDEDGSDNIWELTFEDMSYIVNKGTSQYLYLMADVNAMDQTAGGLTEAKKIAVKAELTDLTAIGESSSDDITATLPGGISNATYVRANVPATIELIPVDLNVGNNVIVGKVKITMAAQSDNKNDEGVLKAILNTLDINVEGVGSNTTGTLIGYRKDGSSTTIDTDLTTFPDADLELIPGQSVIYNIYANVTTDADNPRVQISLTNNDVNTDIVILDQALADGGVPTLLNIGNGVTPEMSVTSK